MVVLNTLWRNTSPSNEGKFIIAMVMLTITALITTPATAKSPPPVSGAEDVRANILLMLDRSGSMNEIITEGESQYPMDVAFDSEGNTYVATYYDYVEKYNSDGDKVLSWGGYGSSNGKFDNIYAIAVDSSDNIYVTDYNQKRVQKFNSDGTYLLKFSITNSSNSNKKVYGIATDSSNYVYVINGDGNLEKFNSSGVKQGSTWNLPDGTRHIAIDGNNNIYVTVYDEGQHWWESDVERIYRYSNTGSALSPAYFNLGYAPYGIATDNLNQIYVTAESQDRIYKYTSTGTYLQYWGSYGSDAGEFNSPRGIEKSSDGVVYAADYYNHRIQSPEGVEPIQPALEETRLEAMKDVIKTIVSDSEMTAGANFGLMQWSTTAEMLVDISPDGAQEIYNTIDNLNSQLYTYLDEGMELAQSYMLGNDSPMLENASCQQNILMVISDGYWVDNVASDIAEDLYTDHNIKTFAIGFQTTSNSNYVNLSEAGGTYPDSPLYASNKENLLEVLSGYIRSIISTQLSFSTPTIMPGVSGDDYLLQATFTYKPDHQWKGRLLKFALTDDGLLGETLWDAGSVLNTTAAADRNIWTVGNGITADLNNFTIDNIDRLREPMEETNGESFTDDELTALINFVRGMDSYNEYPNDLDDEDDVLLAGERWKLADIYHSRPLIVGAPTAQSSDEAQTNSEAYYRFTHGYSTFRYGSSCGGVCTQRDEIVYVGSNGGMIHAFNADTGAERWAFIPPNLLPSLKDMISLDSNASSSIYGVDGTPVVKDIYYEGAWHTVLMIGMRQGGHSYTALDITNPDAPTHIFTIASYPDRDLISYWGSDGVRVNYDTVLDAIPTEYDVRELGETWSEPVIMNIPVVEAGKWVAIAGGGFNSGVTSAYGAKLFVFDLENEGQILTSLTIADGNGSNNIVNAVPPRVTAITPDSTTLFQNKGGLVYFADLEGKLWKVNFTDSGTLYDTTQIFDAEATSSNDRYSFHDTTITITPDHRLMQYFGTANMQNIGNVGASIANRAYGIYDENFPNFASVTDFTVADMIDVTSEAACPDGDQQGWYISMEANEKITGKMTIAQDTVFIPRYVPDADAICSAGTAKLSEVEFTCGNDKRTIELGSGMPQEVIVYKNKLYIGVSTDEQSEESLPDGFVKQGNIIIGAPVDAVTGTVRVETWKEEF